MSRDFHLSRQALNALLSGPEGRRFFKKAADEIRDRARVNADGISTHTDAIISEVGVDSEGVYADIGYDKTNPGFVLWWHEVGTRDFPPRPHLRPAVEPGSI